MARQRAEQYGDAASRLRGLPRREQRPAHSGVRSIPRAAASLHSRLLASSRRGRYGDSRMAGLYAADGPRLLCRRLFLRYPPHGSTGLSRRHRQQFAGCHARRGLDTSRYRGRLSRRRPHLRSLSGRPSGPSRLQRGPRLAFRLLQRHDSPPRAIHHPRVPVVSGRGQHQHPAGIYRAVRPHGPQLARALGARRTAFLLCRDMSLRLLLGQGQSHGSPDARGPVPRQRAAATHGNGLHQRPGPRL